LLAAAGIYEAPSPYDSPQWRPPQGFAVVGSATEWLAAAGISPAPNLLPQGSAIVGSATELLAAAGISLAPSPWGLPQWRPTSDLGPQGFAIVGSATEWLAAAGISLAPSPWGILGPKDRRSRGRQHSGLRPREFIRRRHLAMCRSGGRRRGLGPTFMIVGPAPLPQPHPSMVGSVALGHDPTP
jgi:hypothetical protein